MNIYNRLKKAITIGEYYRHKGLEFDPDIDLNGGQFRCQIHGEDRHPSARYYPDTGMMKCHACGFSGDVITVVQKIENFENTGEAVNYLLTIFPQKNLEPVINPDFLKTGNTGVGNTYIIRARAEIFEAMGNRVWDSIDLCGDLREIQRFNAFTISFEKEEDLDKIFKEFEKNF